MKVAYVLGIFPKLSESFIINEIVELLKRGHDIQIFSYHLPKDYIRHEVFKEYSLLERTHYFSFKGLFQINLIYFLKYFLTGLVMDLLDFKVSARILEFNLKAAYFAAVIRNSRVDLLHSHFTTTGSLSKRLSEFLGIPYLLTAHAFDIYMSQKNELRNVMEDARSIITISEYNKNYLQQDIGIKNRIEVVRCGIDIEKFNPAFRSYPDNKIKMLTVTRLVEKKGLEYLIKAIPIVLTEIKDIDLTIVGSGPLENHLKQVAKDLSVEEYINFRGGVSDSELKHYYENADMFILPCVIAGNGDRDGIPVAIMEAMAMELPIISTMVSGIPELVADGISGILVPQRDEAAIAVAILKLSKDKDLRHRMGENGRKIINKKYNIVSESKKLVNIYNSMRYK